MNLSRKWIESLDDEDLSFIRRFVLASGSLKEIARIYEISYPTVRLRLDRLIAKIQLLGDPVRLLQQLGHHLPVV